MILAAAIQFIAIAVFVTFGALCMLCIDRWLSVASQHRVGPKWAKYGVCSQVVADIIKSIRKSDLTASPRKSKILFWWLATSLPYLFSFFMFSSVSRSRLGGFELLVLFIIFLIAKAFDAIGVIATSNANEAYSFRKNIVLSAVGVTVMIFSFLTVVLKIGGSSMRALAAAQAEVPYYLIFKGPGIFLAALVFLCGILLVSGDVVVGRFGSKSLDEKNNYAFIFLDRLWLLSLTCFWVLLFAGGPPHGYFIFSFIIRVTVILLLVIWSGRVIPTVRSHDAIELGISVLLPATITAFLIESAFLAYTAWGHP